MTRGTSTLIMTRHLRLAVAHASVGNWESTCKALAHAYAYAPSYYRDRASRLHVAYVSIWLRQHAA